MGGREGERETREGEVEREREREGGRERGEEGADPTIVGFPHSPCTCMASSVVRLHNVSLRCSCGYDIIALTNGIAPYEEDKSHTSVTSIVLYLPTFLFIVMRSCMESSK